MTGFSALINKCSHITDNLCEQTFYIVCMKIKDGGGQTANGETERRGCRIY